jgi:hypothetical protein
MMQLFSGLGLAESFGLLQVLLRKRTAGDEAASLIGKETYERPTSNCAA